MRNMATTKTMEFALAKAAENGGELIRLPGGYWTGRGVNIQPTGAPAWYVGSTTVNALLARKRVEVSRWQQGKHKRFPISVRVVAA